jgi:hypothetical protein
MLFAGCHQLLSLLRVRQPQQIQHAGCCLEWQSWQLSVGDCTNTCRMVTGRRGQGLTASLLSRRQWPCTCMWNRAVGQPCLQSHQQNIPSVRVSQAHYTVTAFYKPTSSARTQSAAAPAVQSHAPAAAAASSFISGSSNQSGYAADHGDRNTVCLPHA